MPTAAQYGFLGDVLGAGLSFGGGMFQASASKDMQEDQQDFIKQMYQNRYQYTMEDMRRAGLNPILAAGGGFGGVGTAGGGGIAQMPNPLEGAASTARSSAARHLARKNLEKTANNIDADTGKKGTESSLNSALEKEAGARADVAANTAKKVAVETEAAKAGLVKILLEASFYGSDEGARLHKGRMADPNVAPWMIGLQSVMAGLIGGGKSATELKPQLKKLYKDIKSKGGQKAQEVLKFLDAIMDEAGVPGKRMSD